MRPIALILLASGLLSGGGRAYDAHLPGLDTAKLSQTKPGSTLRVAVAKRKLNQGEALTYKVAYSNLPEGAGLVIGIYRDVAQPSLVDYKGQGGPLMLTPKPVNGSANLEETWDGVHVGCAPTDFATWCDNLIEPGRYRIVASVLDTSNFRFLGWPDNSQRTVLLQTYSEPFILTKAHYFDFR